MSEIEDRVTALEASIAGLTRHPVRDELLALRDVYGIRLDAIDGRLRLIEGDLSETTGWIERRLGDIDGALAEIIRRLS